MTIAGSPLVMRRDVDSGAHWAPPSMGLPDACRADPPGSADEED